MGSGDQKSCFLPALALFLLAPFTAEYLIGYLDATGNFLFQLGGLVIFAPLYGGPALIIREAARRAGRGLPSMAILAAAFGLLQAGIIDHSLFAASLGNADWDVAGNLTLIPLLGISGNNTLNFIAGHVVWSIVVPIILIERCFPDRKTAPWMNKKGMLLVVLLWGVAAAMIFFDRPFDSGPVLIQQLIGIGAVLIALICAAFAFGRKERLPIPGIAPSPTQAGILLFLLLNARIAFEMFFGILGIFSNFVSGWGGFAVELLAYIAVVYFLMRWSRRENWSDFHLIAFAGSALLTRAWVAFLVVPLGDVPLEAKLMNNALLLMGSLALIFFAIQRMKKYVSQQESTPLQY